MNQEYFFQNAKWVGASDRKTDSFSIVRGYFDSDNAKKVSLNILGLGFFKCYINGKCINPDTFLPLSSDYEDSCDPKDEILSGHRIYVPQFDITPFVKNGKNSIAIHFGGGWYTYHCRAFGLPKAIYLITVEETNGVRTFGSDEQCKIRNGYIEKYGFTTHEHHNYLESDNFFDTDFDDSNWDNAVYTEELNTEYCTTDCPTDTLIEELPVKVIGNGDEGVIYDCGLNTVGYPVIEINGEKGSVVTIRFCEHLTADKKLDKTHIHDQEFKVVCDGQKKTVQPEFTWFGFRYFEVIGNAEPKYVKVVHANVKSASTFECDNETINWIYNTFKHTMLCNMHTGHPSDCPHIERRGYTGDGQLTCNAALYTLDAKAFYEKWAQDIADCQDKLTGHIQYTAPYLSSGGGPGGWGCAIVEVPYQIYRHYGDVKILEKYYGNMRRYIDYLEAHSEYGLVTSDKEGAWCLGDWCCPVILYPEKQKHFGGQFIIPQAMVNTYFMVKSLVTLRKIAEKIGKNEDLAEYDQKIDYHKNAIRAAYFNTFGGSFCMNAQGANAFALDIGLGTKSTYSFLVEYYKLLGWYDTGIFGTDIVTRVLFEGGDADLAVDLLKNDGEQGFEQWRKIGATSFLEYWDIDRSRSYSHPMFGSPVAYFFEYLLGIKQKEDSAGFVDLVIAPQAVSKFGHMSGSIETVNGKVAVSYQKEAETVCFSVTIPQGTKAIFKFNDTETVLHEGINELRI